MRRKRLWLVAAVFGLWPAVVLLGGPGETPRPLSVLFLGDRGHHRPADRAAQLIPVLHDRGIEVTYTEKLSDLNPETLVKYDALAVYANIDRIEPEQEKALLDYVAGGGGFVPLHCASFCFRNSDPVVALMGAQFLRHGTGEFDTKVVDTSHPITKDLEPFRTWDETYVHSKHNEKDRHVLQVRQEGDRDEPWTWVRTHGKGRVFYTAYGHDGRTWGQPAFHDLIERGIRWASGKGEVFDSHPKPRAGLPPFTYDKATDPIPNYLPGKRWGTQGETITTMQHPLPPEESVKHMVLPKGFEARLFASEPDIAKPLCMAWDHKGRLWIAESTDYPNNLKPVGTGDDRIKVCEDTDGDGKADKFTVFAEKLSIPTSIAFHDGGILVHDAPDTLFLKDTDGDGKADVRKVVFTGWGTRDTHAGPSNLRYGFDNQFWGMVGYSGFSGQVGGERQRFSQGFYRFKPDGSKLEFLRSTNNNTWGLGLTEEGIVFGSTANGCPSVYLPVPNRYYEGVRGWSPSVLANIASWNRFFPITENVRQVDWHGGFTAAAGHAIYTARAYPKHYWNRTAFVSEPTGHLTATFLLEQDGSDFTSDNSWNLVASDDEWTSPISAEVGPDGHVWVIDWYNFIVQHNPTPVGFQTGTGAAYVTPLRDKTHGRIYRIVYSDAKPSTITSLDPNDARGLVAALKSDNQFWRMHAQRLLVERGKKDVVPQLVAMTEDKSVDAIGLNPGAIHALWTLHGLGASAEASAAAVAALKHPSAGVRRNALQVLERGDAAVKAILSAGMLHDNDPQVRLAACLALADLPPNKEAAKAIALELARGEPGRDRWLGDAITSAAAANAEGFLEALAAVKFERPPTPTATQIVSRVAEHYARGGPSESVGALMAVLSEYRPGLADAVVAGLVRGWPRDKPAKLTDDQEKAMVALLPKLSASSRGPLVSLAGRWGSKGLEKYTGEIAATLLATARDDKRDDETRSAAARQLVEFRKKDTAAALGLLELITPRTSPALASGLVAAVSQTESAEVGPALVDRLSTLTPSARSEAVRSLIGRDDWAPAFLAGVEQGKVRLDELSLDQKQALAGHPNKTIASRAKDLLTKGGGLPDADRQKVIDQLSAIVLKPGDAAKGKLVFQQQCAKCHRHSGEGGKVGPDLTGMAAHPKTELLVNILDPSRSVEGNFVSYTVATTDGRTYNGLLASETKTAVELIDTEGKTQKLLREDIEELVASKKSLMPDGFEKQIPPESIADLITFLTQRGKYMPLDLRKVATVSSVQGMFFDKESSVDRLIFPDWSPKTFEGVPFVLVDPEGGRSPNVVLLYGPNGTTAPKMPKAVSLPCNAPVRAVHLLSGISGWGYNGGDRTRNTVSMIVRLHYAGGETEDHPLRDGVEFADYVRRVDVPGSTFAFALRDQQVRYLSVLPRKADTIESIELVKGPDRTAPLVMAVTVELP
jgi:putative membrane-bound dehydrogenase-like protein